MSVKHVRISARLFPKGLNFLQKLSRMSRWGHGRTNQFRPKIYETPIYRWGDMGYEIDINTSVQASEWRLTTKPKPKKSYQSRTKVNQLTVYLTITVFVIHSEFLRNLVNSKKKTRLLKILGFGTTLMRICTVIVNEIFAKKSTNAIGQSPCSLHFFLNLLHIWIDELTAHQILSCHRSPQTSTT